MTRADDRLAWSVDEFAKLIGVSPRFIYLAVERGEGPPLVRVGKRTLVRREAAEEWLRSREQSCAPADSGGGAIDVGYLDVLDDLIISILDAAENPARVRELVADALSTSEEARGVAAGPGNEPAAQDELL